MATSKAGRSHHTHGHGHKHERKDLKRDAGQLMKNQSFPSAATAYTGPHTSSPSHAGGGITASRQPQQMAVATAGTSAESFLWGEVESGSHSVGHKHPIRPLWHEGWRATSITCAVPALYQPPPLPPPTGEPTASLSTVLEHPCDQEGCNLTLHCIDLQHHIQELKSMISVLPSRQEILPGSDPLKNSPPIPSRFWSASSKEQPRDSLLSPSLKLPLVRLDRATLHHLQRKSVAAICAHAGYESSSSRALDTLTDVLGDFLTKLSKLLRVNTDQQAESGDVGFQDVLDRSLYQCGIAGKEALHRHWQHNVKGYASRLQQAAVEHHEEYQRLTEPPGPKQPVAKSASVVSSLVFTNPGRRDAVDFRLPSPWPTSTPDLGVCDEEIPLESVMQQANLDIVAPTRTPDLGTPGVAGMFSHFSDSSTPETEGFTAFTMDGPPRKRLRTISLTADQQ